MLEADGNKANGENQRGISDFLQTCEQLEKEAKMLTVEKEDLLAAEEELHFMLYEEIETRRRKNLLLRLEVEEQKKKCVELTKILNYTIRGNDTILTLE
jgi:hypothetical protein